MTAKHYSASSVSGVTEYSMKIKAEGGKMG